MSLLRLSLLLVVLFRHRMDIRTVKRRVELAAMEGTGSITKYSCVRSYADNNSTPCVGAVDGKHRAI